mmetsp:Transcript_29820/g.48150  ORF Transcript_29820/g.48150 Transcript_29820/m.48150 type:complete len:666 (-) Transcript_29820:148-2145(-)|eukprot:CAMPEP_0184647808 /NCGR_PEP_ID=MMETSP0308-20130426/4812_1 /TAXON_ID=38269 /ORGANISM="Gloeochaete witrockiana, Strain SAG 46.84" /LENGTH=665 /DNA_ID=CAMNT_0027079109 /DNA_START=75 /DNA_END=2072 /DNA_ORIENTATION=+
MDQAPAFLQLTCNVNSLKGTSPLKSNFFFISDRQSSSATPTLLRLRRKTYALDRDFVVATKAEGANVGDEFCVSFVSCPDSTQLPKLMQWHATASRKQDFSEFSMLSRDLEVKTDTSNQSPSTLKFDISYQNRLLDEFSQYVQGKGRIGRDTRTLLEEVRRYAVSGDIEALEDTIGSLGASKDGMNAERKYWIKLVKVLLEKGPQVWESKFLSLKSGMGLRLLLRRLVAFSFRTEGARDIFLNELRQGVKPPFSFRHLDALMLPGRKGFCMGYEQEPVKVEAARGSEVQTVAPISYRGMVEREMMDPTLQLEAEIQHLLKNSGLENDVGKDKDRQMLEDLRTSSMKLLLSSEILTAMDDAPYLSPYDVATVLVAPLEHPLYIHLECHKAVWACNVLQGTDLSSSPDILEGLTDRVATNLFSIINGPRRSASTKLSLHPLPLEALVAYVLLDLKHQHHPYISSYAREIRWSLLDVAPPQILLMHLLLSGNATPKQVGSAALWHSPLLKHLVCLERDLATREEDMNRLSRLQRMWSGLLEMGVTRTDLNRLVSAEPRLPFTLSDDDMEDARSVAASCNALRSLWRLMLIEQEPLIWSISTLFTSPMDQTMDGDDRKLRRLLAACKMTGANSLAHVLLEGKAQGFIPNCAAGMALLSAYGYFEYTDGC